jgi:hypothetical protein
MFGILNYTFYYNSTLKSDEGILKMRLPTIPEMLPLMFKQAKMIGHSKGYTERNY